jgi:hypothetical protein
MRPPPLVTIGNSRSVHDLFSVRNMFSSHFGGTGPFPRPVVPFEIQGWPFWPSYAPQWLCLNFVTRKDGIVGAIGGFAWIIAAVKG